MSIALPRVTRDEFLRREAEVPQGVRLELMNGRIRETNTSARGAWHAFVLMRTAYLVGDWIDRKLEMPIFAGVGEVRCEITQDPPQIVGIDLGVWIGPEYANLPEAPSHPRTAPALAVEVLSPSDTHCDVVEKRKLYLDSGVLEVWYVDAELRVLTVHHANAETTFLTASQRYVGSGTFAGLEFDVRLLFERGAIR